MIVDSSAIVSIFMREPGHERLAEIITTTAPMAVGAPTLVETGIVLTARLRADARTLLTRFVDECGIDVIPFGADHWREALRAYDRFGKGRHPAALNLGDCLSYAVASLAEQPLLCTGNDFGKTDLEAVQG